MASGHTLEHSHCADKLNQISTLTEAPNTITRYETLPGSTDVVYSTIREVSTSTIFSVQPGRTVFETSIQTEEGGTSIAYQTLTVSSCSTPVGPATPPVVLTRTLPGVTHTSFVTIPGSNNSVVQTQIITSVLPGPTQVITAPCGQTTATRYETLTLPGSTYTALSGGTTITEYSTRTLPGFTITSVVSQPGSNTTITETKTCYETTTASPEGPVSPARESTIYATSYITKELPTTYTADQTCSETTVFITASDSGWDKPDGYRPHSTATDEEWGDKPSSYGGSASFPTGSWRRS